VEGVHQWQQHAPPLVILDILMPQMNGLEALAHIRQAEPRAGLWPGLAIVSHLVTLMNGKIEVSSEIDRGTRMRVVLPLIEPSE
jgi:CheY-like chemotaxis protein